MLKIVERKFAFETTALHLIVRPLTTTDSTASDFKLIFSTSQLIRTSQPLALSSFSIDLTNLSVPPWNTNTPLDMKLENTIPYVSAGSSSVDPLA